VDIFNDVWGCLITQIPTYLPTCTECRLTDCIKMVGAVGTWYGVQYLVVAPVPVVVTRCPQGGELLGR
jgi:hypothetical protein